MKQKNIFRIPFLTLFLFVFIHVAFGQLPDDFPNFTVNKTGETGEGYLFMSVSSDTEGIGYYIIMLDDETGLPFKYKKLKDDYSYDFKVQPNGFVSYAQFLSHHDYTGGGNCIHMVLDEDMNPVDSFQLGNGYIAEAHDFQLLPNGNVLAFGYYLTHMDLSDLVEGGYPNAMVSGGIVQELDQDKNVVWQWRSWDHYNPETYAFGNRSARQTVSEFHLNTINLDTDGNMFLGTPSWTKKINRQTGEIMWHLGGDENQFSFVGVDSIEGIGDLTGHAFHRLENGNVLIYDNGPRRGNGTSEAHEYSLDEENLVATKIKTFTPDEDIQGWHRGSAQRLPNGNTLVGWGGATGDHIPTCTEFDAEGNSVLEVYFADDQSIESYRVVRHPYPPDTAFIGTEEEVALGNTYNFTQGDTTDIGVEIKIDDFVSVGYNELYVLRYNYAPKFPGFDGRAPMVLPQRVVLDEFAINYIGGDIAFNIDKFGIENPNDITVYHRPTEGEGEFKALTTSYNNVKREIKAGFDDFGEFIFTYPDIAAVTAMAPIPQSPKRGEKVNFAEFSKFEWSQDGFFESFELEVATDKDFSNVVLNQESNSTVYSSVYMGLSANTNYYWRVRMTNEAGQTGWSDTAHFITKAPYVELTVPNGGEVWTRGLDHFIEWDDNIDGNVILELYKDNSMIMTIDTVKNTNAYLWELPTDLDSACGYFIKIKSLANMAVQDVSDSTFAVNDSTCQKEEVAYLELISPNGGEEFRKGEPVTINWKNTSGEPVNIDLHYKTGNFIVNLFSNLGENSQTWTPTEVNPGVYKIVITTAGSLALSDTSNYSFTLHGQTSVNDIKPDKEFLLYPNPATENITIKYNLENNMLVSIKMVSLDGREIESVLERRLTKGNHQIRFNIAEYPSGRYLLQIKYGDRSENHLLVIH